MFLQCCVTTQVDVLREALCTDMAEYLSLPCETLSGGFNKNQPGIGKRLDSRSQSQAHVAVFGFRCAGSNRRSCSGKLVGRAFQAAPSEKNSDDRTVGYPAADYPAADFRRPRNTHPLLMQSTSVVERCLAASTSSSVPPPRSVLCVLTTRERVSTRAVATPP